jgi:hypothetical protein
MKVDRGCIVEYAAVAGDCRYVPIGRPCRTAPSMQSGMLEHFARLDQRTECCIAGSAEFTHDPLDCVFALQAPSTVRIAGVEV